VLFRSVEAKRPQGCALERGDVAATKR